MISILHLFIFEKKKYQSSLHIDHKITPSCIKATIFTWFNPSRYLGQGNFCKERSSPTKGKFKGFTRIPQFNDQALMEALYSRGPIAVSLDASQESFTFYSTGVYYDPACMWHADELDHSMMLVGYGTDEHGEDYWLIKNSWSANWGDNGYVKVSRDNHGCGASTDAVYAVVDEEWKSG